MRMSFHMTIKNMEKLIDYITKVEIFSATAYKATDKEKKYTMYLVNGYVISEEEAKVLLVQDLQAHIPTGILTEVYNAGNTLMDYQIDVLVSLRFSNGSITTTGSPLFTAYLKSGNYNEKETLNKILSYTTQGQTVLPGLVKRRIAEAMIFSGYGYPEINGDNFYSDKELINELYNYASNLGEERAKYCVE